MTRVMICAVVGQLDLTDEGSRGVRRKARGLLRRACKWPFLKFPVYSLNDSCVVPGWFLGPYGRDLNWYETSGNHHLSTAALVLTSHRTT